MTIAFSTTTQMAATNGVKLLVYAQAGEGKTSLCATAPAPLIISAEAGLLSLSKQNIERMYGVGTPGISYDMPVINISKVEDLVEAYDWCRDFAVKQGFQTICLDSISEIAEVVLNNAKRQVKDPRQAYGELIEKMTTTIRAFRDLPGVNVYMTSKMAPSTDDAGVTKRGPGMPGKTLANDLPYFFDEVFRLCTAKDDKGVSFRYLQTQPDLQYIAKDRSGALHPSEHPNLAYIFAKIAAAPAPATA